MNDDAYEDAFLEKEIKTRFDVSLDITKMIIRRAPAGPAIWASVFVTSNKTLFVFIEGTKTMTFGDARRVTKRMGIRADRFFPPYGEKDYFNAKAKAKFKDVFPGRPITDETDLRHYKSLVSYSPALASVLEVPDSKIRQYDSDAADKWRVVAKYNYRSVPVKTV